VNRLLRIAFIVLMAGVVIMLLAPAFLTFGAFSSFKTTGQIGDTIGGITAPISSLVGSILVFLALKGQVLANQITQQQIREQQQEEMRKKEIVYISDLYKYFIDHFNAFQTKYYNGHRAMMKVLKSLADSESKDAHDDSRLYYGTTGQLFSILQLGTLFLDQLHKSGLEKDDKSYFKRLMRHHYDSFILPYLTRNESAAPCPRCGEKHNGIPLKMHAVINEALILM